MLFALIWFEKCISRKALVCPTICLSGRLSHRVNVIDSSGSVLSCSHLRWFALLSTLIETSTCLTMTKNFQLQRTQVPPKNTLMNWECMSCWQAQLAHVASAQRKQMPPWLSQATETKIFSLGFVSAALPMLSHAMCARLSISSSDRFL